MKDYMKLNLQLFATAANTTDSKASGNDLSPEMKTYYSQYLIDMAEPKLVHNQFGQKQDIPQNGGKIIEFRKYSALPKATTPLTEGVTPDGQPLDVSTVVSTVNQYGGWISLPDMLILTAIDKNMVEATKLLGAQAGKTLDTVTREVLNGGTSVQYGDGTSATSRAALTDADKMSVDVIKRAVRFLRAQDAPEIDGSYIGIVHPDVAYDIMSDPAFIDITKYGDPNRNYDGEIGKLAGVRFVESTEAKIWEKANASSHSVYSTLIIGADAYGVTSVTGGGLETIVKQLGSAGTADPLNQRASVGWKALATAERLVETYMIRVETSSTFSSAAN